MCFNYHPPKRKINLCFHWNVNVYVCKTKCDISTEREKEEGYQICLLHICTNTYQQQLFFQMSNPDTVPEEKVCY